MFNYEQFKTQFRQAARARGIDPERGATEFQVALVQAEARRDQHHSRQRAQVRAAAERQFARGTFPSEGRGFLHDDKSLDTEMIARVESAEWWKYLTVDDWKSGGDGSAVERTAFAAIRHEIAGLPKSRTKIELEDMGDAMREVLTEKPTQAAMQVKYPQSEKVESAHRETLASAS